MALAGHAAFTPTGSPQAASTGPNIRVAPEQPEASTTIEGERKTVTALFVDIKGSTELMEELDPEEARAIIDPALKLMIDAAHRYDGYVVQSTGDGIFALFGAPVAHEDHPQRALYAALRMQEELRRYSAKVIADGGMRIEARVGANTGEVVVRSITTGAGQVEYTPIGHTTNLASRMQAVAPTGSIAISEQTRKFVEGYFALKPLGPTRVKGVTEPVNVYEVTGLGPLRTRLQRSAGRGLTKFVGREREMEALKHAADRAISGRGQIVAAMAEAGTGKSRLYYEFKAKNQSGWMVLETFSVSHGKASAYLPVLDLLHGYFKIAGQDDERTRREKVAGKIAILDRNLEDTLPYLFGLLGIVEGDDPLAQMDGQIKKRRTLEAIKRILLRESLNQPLMAIFEDLHWIDEATQELLNLLADSLGTAKILLLVNYRPEYSHGWGSKTYYTQLRLDPLGQESADEMLSALLGTDSQLAALKQLITEKTEGNPFFMEETVQVLFDEGALVHDGSAMRLTRPLGELKIPPTVQGILAARIDRLPADAKELLQTLAVIGRDFPLSLIRAVWQHPHPRGTAPAQRGAGAAPLALSRNHAGEGQSELERMLNDLQLGEFIYEQPAVGDTEYIFKHALTQEVAYNSVLIERRQQLHERAGEALEAMFAGQLEDHLDELAHHYSRSDNIERAVDYVRRFGERALSRSLYRDARDAFETALLLIDAVANTGDRDREKLRLCNVLVQSLFPLEGWAGKRVEHTLARALSLVPVVNDSAEVQGTLVSHWLFTGTSGSVAEGRLIVDKMGEDAARSGIPALIAKAHIPAANTYFYLGEFEIAARHGEEGSRSWRPEYYDAAFWPGDPRVFGLSFRGRALAAMGFPDRGLHCIQQALAFGKEQSNKFSYLIGLLEHTYWFPVLVRDLKLATSIADEALRLLDELDPPDRRVFEAYAAWPRALATGQFVDAIDTLDQVFRFEKDRRELPNAHFHLAQVADLCVRARSAPRGLAVVEEALAFADSSGARHNEAELWRLRGELLLLQEVHDEVDALMAFTRAIQIARNQRARLLELRATMSLARLLAKQGKRDEARTMLAEIYNWFTEGFDTADIIDAKALLDQLRG